MDTNSPKYNMIEAREDHADQMAEIFVAAFVNENLAGFKVVTDMRKSLYWANSLGHVMVVEDTHTGNLVAWFSLRERSERDTSITKAKEPEAWEATLSEKLLEKIKQLEDEYQLQSAVKKPPNRPAELLATVMASHLLDDRPELLDRNFFVLDTIAIHPEYQRQGIGKELLEHGCSLANQYDLCILAQVPKRNRVVEILGGIGFRVLSGLSIAWGDNFEGATGNDFYFSMWYLPEARDLHTA